MSCAASARSTAQLRAPRRPTAVVRSVAPGLREDLRFESGARAARPVPLLLGLEQRQIERVVVLLDRSRLNSMSALYHKWYQNFIMHQLTSERWRWTAVRLGTTSEED